MDMLGKGNVEQTLKGVINYIKTYPYKDKKNQLLKNHTNTFTKKKVNFWAELEA